MRATFSKPALLQLGVHLDYIRERNPKAADRLAARMQAALVEIAASPKLGRLQDVEGVRKKVLLPDGYLLFFSVNEAEQLATVLAVVGPKQVRPYQDI